MHVIISSSIEGNFPIFCVMLGYLWTCTR